MLNNGPKTGSSKACGRAFSRVCRKGVRKGVRRVASRKRALLLRLCPRRFGPLSPQAQARFERATLEQLETWADRLLDVQTLDELFGENPQS
ncbi:DUF4351 domain-containing protein [uncultured Thiocystis sp.]|uniref:DUF4351 domain-containing protein n=1 Tax=uncultured Thiocystis sp. TaxID=1202134 RepID=UPI003445CA99